MDKGPSWLVIIVPAVGAITGVLMALLAYFTLREKYGERQMAVFKQTADMRIAGLEREVEYIKERLAAVEKEHAECLARVETLTAEKYDLMRRLFERPKS